MKNTFGNLTWLAGKWKAWRCISYWKWWCSIAMLIYQRVKMLNFFMARLPVFGDAFVTLLIRKVFVVCREEIPPPRLEKPKRRPQDSESGWSFWKTSGSPTWKHFGLQKTPRKKWLLGKRFLGILVMVYSYSFYSYWVHAVLETKVLQNTTCVQDDHDEDVDNYKEDNFFSRWSAGRLLG